jgi:hypothetical protein
MEIKTFDDLVKLQQQFADRVNKGMAPATSVGALTPDELDSAKRAMLKDAQTALAATQQAKDETAKRLDGDIARLQQKIAGLERDIGQIEKAQRAEVKATPDTPKRRKTSSSSKKSK